LPFDDSIMFSFLRLSPGLTRNIRWFTSQNLGNDKEQIRESLKQYQQALKEGESAEILYNISLLQFQLGNILEAKKHAMRSIELKSDESDVHVLMGNLENLEGKHQNALNYYSKALEITSDDAETIYNQALTFDKLGQLDEAIQKYQKAIDLNKAIPSTNLRNAIAKKMRQKVSS